MGGLISGWAYKRTKKKRFEMSNSSVDLSLLLLQLKP